MKRYEICKVHGIKALPWHFMTLRNGCLADAAAACGRVLLRSQVLQLAGNLQPLVPGPSYGCEVSNTPKRRREYIWSQCEREMLWWELGKNRKNGRMTAHFFGNHSMRMGMEWGFRKFKQNGCSFSMLDRRHFQQILGGIWIAHLAAAGASPLWSD